MKKISTHYKVSIADINYGGHMGNDKALSIFHNARINFLEYFGYSEASISDDVGIILTEANIKFKKEVLLHDELEVEVWISKVKGVRWTLSYKAVRKADNAEVFSGTTLMVPFNYKTRKICHIPKKFLIATFEEDNL